MEPTEKEITEGVSSSFSILIAYFSPPMLLPFFLSHLASVHPGIPYLSVGPPVKTKKRTVHDVVRYQLKEKGGFILRRELRNKLASVSTSLGVFITAQVF